MVLAVCVLGHLAVMAYAVFVLGCAAHVPIGVARIAEEWFGWRAVTALWFARAFALLIVVTGLRAVYAVTWA
jgi:fumarate reductase subunit C